MTIACNRHNVIINDLSYINRVALARNFACNKRRPQSARRAVATTQARVIYRRSSRNNGIAIAARPRKGRIGRFLLIIITACYAMCRLAGIFSWFDQRERQVTDVKGIELYSARIPYIPRIPDYRAVQMELLTTPESVLSRITNLYSKQNKEISRQ